MTEAPGGDLDVLALGSALVDVLALAEDAQVAALGLVKGSMKLVSEGEADRLYEAVGPAVEVCGGSAANTAVGVAGLGASSAYIARVGDDRLGRVFAREIRSAGVEYDSPPAGSGPATGRCLVLVTPDAQRTMCTYLGAAARLGPDYVQASLVERARVVYMEGYLWDLEPAKQALRLAAQLARPTGALVALSLSDTFCVERHRKEFLQLLEDGVDLMFANEDEARLLFEMEDLDQVLERIRASVDIAAVTRGASGSVVVSGAETVEVGSFGHGPVLDTTGAGDLYAAGFLVGLARGASLERCARLGSMAAAEVISHLGSRPATDLRFLAEEAGLAP